MLVVLPNAFGDAAQNMAIDAALLKTIPDRTALFRHYGWTEPAVTFGYSQRHAEVTTTADDGVALCRRATGGGIVDHRNDWTYTLVLHASLEAAKSSSTELYHHVHASIASALAKQNASTQLAPCPRKCDDVPTKPDGPDQCFIQPVMNDVLSENGRKIAGAAMKRTRLGLLIQGSLDRGALPDELDFSSFQAQFISELSHALQLEIKQPEDLRPYFDGDLIKQEKEKFSSNEWNHRR